MPEACISRREFMGVAGTAAAGLAVASAAAAEGDKPKARSDSYCGLYCGACPNVVAGRQDPANAKCLGCKSEKTAGWCSKCEIKDCAKGKGLESCGECDKRTDCEKLTAFHHNGKDYRLLAAKNVATIADKGRKTWLAEQKERWTCSKCDTRFSWDDTKCPKCGAKVRTCTQEAAELKK